MLSYVSPGTDSRFPNDWWDIFEVLGTGLLILAIGFLILAVLASWTLGISIAYADALAAGRGRFAVPLQRFLR